MHSLLQRQLEQYLGKDSLPDAHLRELFVAISQHYDEVEAKHNRLEQKLDAISATLSAANTRLYEQSCEVTHAMLDTLLEGVFATDVDGRFTFINTSAEQMLDWHEQDILGREVHDIIGHTGLDGSPLGNDDWKIKQVLSSRQAYSGEENYIGRDGRVVPVLFRIHPLLQGEHVIGALVSFEDISERKQHEEMVWAQANFDMLTQLPNRRMFRDRLGQELKKSHRVSCPLALLFIDLDKFKEVNDAFGHEAGDQLLIQVAARLKSCVRDSDTVARLGGDEFTVILSQLVGNRQVEKIAQNILYVLSQPFDLGSDVANVSASIGIAFYPADATEVDDIIKYADQAMYAAKHKGRNAYSYFTPSMQEAVQEKIRLIKDLRGALANQQLHVCYQPVINLQTGFIDKAEALLRWHHPLRGIIEPSDFIHLAEETGMINEIGDWMFKEVAQWLQRWLKFCPDHFQISLNKSPVQFMRDEDCRLWLIHLAELGIQGKHLIIEATEGLLLDPSHNVTDKLYKFRDAGVQVAIDDFGTGYSSLACFNKFHIDYLKIHQSFVHNLAIRQSDMALSEAIIAMAHKLGLKVIAENVETEAQKNLLIAAGCDFAQGHLFSAALSADEFEALLHAAYHSPLSAHHTHSNFVAQ